MPSTQSTFFKINMGMKVRENVLDKMYHNIYHIIKKYDVKKFIALKN